VPSAAHLEEIAAGLGLAGRRLACGAQILQAAVRGPAASQAAVRVPFRRRRGSPLGGRGME
jgi:hypothetical protein